MDRKEKRKKWDKIYRDRNAVKIAEYRENTRDNQKLYREENAKTIKKNKRIYRQTNKKKINEINKKYIKDRRQNDINFRILTNIKPLISSSIKRKGYLKNSKTEQILGCSISEFKQHIESLWKPWMSWENYGLYNGELNYGWDLDHIVPTSSAKTEEDLYNLNHYTNLQPLCSYINRVIKKDN